MQEKGVFDTLVDKLAELPGIGKKTAQRLAFHIMKMDRESALRLARAVEDVKNKVTYCSICFNLTEIDPCAICTDPKRDRSVICVVENPSDVNALEKAGIFRGVYHVLGGALSPLDNIGPDDIRIRELADRLDETVTEVIMATNPTVEGEATAAFIAGHLAKSGVRVSRIARGLPVGGDLELADKVTLARSLEGRLEIK
ncbi:MAG: recombination mediator RecR [Candidatus Latescibacter sp.]|nr:recombination mediator RecR [Candidatus Latescibacter sp.]